MNRLALACVLLVLAGCRDQAGPQDSLDAIARDYVLLSLTIGEKEEGYIDAYYGPPELQAQAKAEAAGQSLDALAKRVTELTKRVTVADRAADRSRHATADAEGRKTVIRRRGRGFVCSPAEAQASSEL